MTGMLGKQAHLGWPLRGAELRLDAEAVPKGHFAQRHSDSPVRDVMGGVDQALTGQLDNAFLEARLKVKVESRRQTPDRPENLLGVLGRAEFLLSMAASALVQHQQRSPDSMEVRWDDLVHIFHDAHDAHRRRG